MKKVFLILVCLLASLAASAQTLLLYGGENHDVFLGKLNESPYDTKSVWNEYGSFGNEYSQTCIWNSYCPYGGEYSQYSPWNSYAQHPPVVVDANGNFYGYLTTNNYNPKQCRLEFAKKLYEFYDVIPNDIEKWYDKIFCRQ